MSKPMMENEALFHVLDAADAITVLKSDATEGLRSGEAQARLQKYGANLLEKGKKKGILRRFMLQFGDFMVLILLAASAISFITSCIQGEADFADSLLILGIVIANALIGTIQEAKAEHALEALRTMSAPHATVVRDGKRMVLESEALVPGDIVQLRSGDIVPADVRLLTATELYAEESALTGESVPVLKSTAVCAEKATVAERRCMLFSGTGVASGHGIGIVTDTGMRTEMGKIAAMLGGEETPDTPLKARLRKTGKLIGIGVVVICAIIFAIGLIQRIDPLEMFMIAISLAVAAIPEGLPAVVTIVLALGVRRMAAKRAIIRHLQAVETLGSTEVICSDKTGTLTQNKMTVVRCVDAAGHTQEIGESPILSAAALCTSVELEGDRLIGEPTETALAAAVEDLPTLLKLRVKAAEVPFTSERKRMTLILRQEDGSYRVLTKGAPDILLQRCTHVEINGQQIRLSGETRARILAANTQMAGEALRVLAVAEKFTGQLPENDNDAESGLSFIGLIALEDPPRPEAARAVLECKRAGIRPVMITGDQPTTALAIAGRLGMENKSAVTGAELETMDDTRLLETVKTCSVYARVSPAHKMRIVKAFRRLNLVTAMTGDGVNDAPALKAADIGCAMGKNGTQVAQNAADMILTDDNFATIVSAVREGRTVYRNIRKTIHFLMSCNIGEILTVLVAFILRAPTPLLPAQLLWVNLVTDSLPALALGSDTMQDDVMRQPPNPRESSVFSGGMGMTMLTEGVMIGALALFAFSLGRASFDTDPMQPVVGRTMAFAVLSLSQLVHSYNMRSAGPVVRRGMFKNRWLNLSFLLCAAMMVLVIAFPPAAALLGTVSLSAGQWGIVAALSLAPLTLCELQKRLFPARKKTAEKDRHTTGVIRLKLPHIKRDNM